MNHENAKSCDLDKQRAVHDKTGWAKVIADRILGLCKILQVSVLNIYNLCHSQIKFTVCLQTTMDLRDNLRERKVLVNKTE